MIFSLFLWSSSFCDVVLSVIFFLCSSSFCDLLPLPVIFSLFPWSFCDVLPGRICFWVICPVLVKATSQELSRNVHLQLEDELMTFRWSEVKGYCVLNKYVVITSAKEVIGLSVKNITGIIDFSYFLRWYKEQLVKFWIQDFSWRTLCFTDVCSLWGLFQLHMSSEVLLMLSFMWSLHHENTSSLLIYL